MYVYVKYGVHFILIRSKAIEYGVIREDEYPGALPSGLEDFLRVSGNVG